MSWNFPLRFRLATVCKDSTGCIAVLFPHEEIQRILGKDVFDIENDETQVSIVIQFYFVLHIIMYTYKTWVCYSKVGESISFPPLLRSFEKKDFLISLKIVEKNINKSSNVYIAHSLQEPPEMLGDHIPSENNTSPLPDVITLVSRYWFL